MKPQTSEPARGLKFQMTTLYAFSSADVSFVFPVSWGMGRGEIKRAEAGEKGNESAQGTLERALPISPARPRLFNFPVLSPCFSPFSCLFPTEGVSSEERDIISESYGPVVARGLIWIDLSS